MEREGSPQKKLVIALEESKGLVRFASSQACNSLFQKVAKFSHEVLERVEKADMKIEDVVESCSCLFTGICEASAAREGACVCCESQSNGHDSSELKFFESFVSEDLSENHACAFCLCLLHQDLM